MSSPPGDPDWPTVTMASGPGDLEPRLRDDAAVVGSAVFAAMRPDRLVVAWLAFLLLRLLGGAGELVGLGSRMLPADPVEAWTTIRETGRVVTPASSLTEGLLGGVFLVAGIFIVVIAAAALIRSDAERLGRDRDIPLVSSLRWAASSWRRLIGAVILPPVLAFLLAVPAMLFGLLTRLPVLDVVAGTLWFVPLVFTFAGGIVAVAWLWSLPLIVPAAACEAGDPVEVTVRVAGLLRRRFPRFLLMVLVAVLAAVPGWLLVSGVVTMTIGLASISLEQPPTVSWPSLGSTLDAATADQVASQGLVASWYRFVVSLAHSWVLGFIVIASGRILLVVRRAADRIPFEDLGEPGPA